MHFNGKPDYERTIKNPIAAVAIEVNKIGRKYISVLAGGISIAKTGTRFCRLKHPVVSSADNTPIPASEGKSFWVSIETIDPFHLVIEL